MTDYFEPRSVDEVCELLQRYGDDAKLLAGGTALVLFMRQGLLDPPCLINIQYLEELAGISQSANENLLQSATGSPQPALRAPQSAPHDPLSAIQIGALTTHTQAASSPLIKQAYPALASTFRHVATPRIRNAGTVGGNLAHGDPHLDPPVTLLALDASVVAQSTRGPRQFPLSEFFRDYYETALAPDEIITHVLVPPSSTGAGAAFIKFLPRSQDDYATVDIAAWVRLPASSDPTPHSPALIEDVRIALGSVGPIPFRALDAEDVLRGEVITDEALADAGERAASACDPEDDVRGSGAYKREIVKVLVGRVLRQAVAVAGGRNGGAR